MQDYGLGLRAGLKDLPTLRTRIHRQILTELKTLYFSMNTFLTSRTDALCYVPSQGAFLCVSFVDSHFQISDPLQMSRKQLLTASPYWVDPDVGSGPHPCTQPHVVPPPTIDYPPEWKASPGLTREEFLPKEAYDSNASTPTKEWRRNREGVCLQLFSMAPLFTISLALFA